MNQHSKTPPHHGVSNVASGQVGIQAGTVTGSTVWIGATPPPTSPADLAAELTAVRDALTRERSSGTLDDTTYEAAQAELDIASTALKADTPESTGTFVLALKRLRGLTADVADLATKITALLAAVNGIS